MLVSTLAVSLVLMGYQSADATASTPSLSTYEQARTAAGRDPDLNVRLALWCEQHGLRAERARHLGIAILAAPDHALAHAMLGLVQADGAWVKPAQVAERVAKDQQRQTLLDEYATRRAAAKLTVDGQLELANWCEKNSLPEQMRAHLLTVVKLDPSRETTWKRLGYQKSNGQWLSPEQATATRMEIQAQKEAKAKWKPELQKLKSALADSKTREAAQAALAEIEDPRSVPAIAAVFGTSGADLPVAVQLLGQIDDPAASLALAWLAYSATDAEVRRVAIETLSQRDVREYAGPLVGLMHTPLKYEVKQLEGPGSPGVLFVEGEKFNIKRVYQAPNTPPNLQFRPSNNGTVFRVLPDGSLVPLPAWSVPPSQAVGRVLNQPTGPLAVALTPPRGGILGNTAEAFTPMAGWSSGNALDSISGWGIDQPPTVFISSGELDRNARSQSNLETYQAALARTQNQLQADLAWVKSQNEGIEAVNSKAATVLEQATSLRLGTDPGEWHQWWRDQIGVVASDPYQPKATLTQVLRTTASYHTSCFKVGTLVHTDKGLLPIERLNVGDVVLSQDVATGSLSYEPILMVHHNPPAMIRRLVAGGQTVETTDLHRFWKVGTGWVMTRELKPGDEIRALGGIVRVESNETGETVPVFNLDVDRSHSYFVGEKGILAHDHTLPDRRVKPFDRVDELALVEGPN